MLKLTSIEPNKIPHVKASLIEWMVLREDDGFTEVRVAGSSFCVTETPEQILAMDEMVKALNPLYCLPGEDPVTVKDFTPEAMMLLRIAR